MFSRDDTIVAIATAPGRAGLGVVRISGPDAHAIAVGLLECSQLQPRRATFTRIRTAPGSSQSIDEIVATWFPAPRSYTGEHVVEVSAHGSPVVLEAIVRAVTAAGARLARPGEFTFRAFLNGRIDLVQAEAVADLIAAATPLQARVAFDQLEGTLTTRINELDRAALRGYGFLTDRPLLIALNRSEDRVAEAMSPEIEQRVQELHAAGLVLSADDGKLCEKCHNSESPTFKGFNFEERWEKIQHPVPKK